MVTECSSLSSLLKLQSSRMVSSASLPSSIVTYMAIPARPAPNGTVSIFHPRQWNCLTSTRTARLALDLGGVECGTEGGIGRKGGRGGGGGGGGGGRRGGRDTCSTASINTQHKQRTAHDTRMQSWCEDVKRAVLYLFLTT